MLPLAHHSHAAKAFYKGVLAAGDFLDEHRAEYTTAQRRL
jgi:hypothetical protein